MLECSTINLQDYLMIHYGVLRFCPRTFTLTRLIDAVVQWPRYIFLPGHLKVGEFLTEEVYCLAW